MSYNVGDFRQPVTLLRCHAGKDKYGREIRTYEPEDITLWCKVTDVSGRDFHASAAQQTEDIVTFTMRCGYGITMADRLRFGGVDYGIVAPNHLGYKGDFEQYRCRDVRSRYWQGDPHG